GGASPAASRSASFATTARASSGGPTSTGWLRSRQQSTTRTRSTSARGAACLPRGVKQNGPAAAREERRPARPKDVVAKRSAGAAGALRGAALAGGDQLALRLAGARVQVQLLLAALLLDPDGDRLLAQEAAAQQLLGERVLQVVLDRPAQRPRPELQAGPLLDQEVLRLVGHHQRQALLLQPLAHLRQFDVDDA